MNWIERLYEIKSKDLYSQNGEGLILEYMAIHLRTAKKVMFDYGGGDGFYLSNSRHLKNLGWSITVIDLEGGNHIDAENCTAWINMERNSLGQFESNTPSIISIDIDGND